MSFARVVLVALAVAALVGGACSFDWDSFDPRQGGASAGGGGSIGMGGGTGAIGGTGGVGGATGTGGSGGVALPPLIDRGLLTRYFIDEAASGTQPSQLVDAAPNPLNLDVDYGLTPSTGGAGGVGGAGGMGSGGGLPNMMYDEKDSHRALRWLSKLGAGGASKPIGSSKLVVLNGATQATIECVVESVDGGAGTTSSRISHLGVNSYGTLTLGIITPQVHLRLNGADIEAWAVDPESLGRIVLHSVLDTTLAAPDDRVKLYVDGVDAGAGSSSTPPAQNEIIDLTAGQYVIGNRNGNDASLNGWIYYCALYSVPFDAAEIANNAAVLGVRDDTP